MAFPLSPRVRARLRVPPCRARFRAGAAGTPRFRPSPALLAPLCFAQGSLRFSPCAARRSPLRSFGGFACGRRLADLAASAPLCRFARRPAVPPSRASFPRSRSRSGGILAVVGFASSRFVAQASPPSLNVRFAHTEQMRRCGRCGLDSARSRIIAVPLDKIIVPFLALSSRFCGINRFAIYSTFGVDNGNMW